MEEKREVIDLHELAERIYNLDKRVYVDTGSSLGRVYSGDKANNIQYIVDLLESKKGAYVLREELALIGNMSKTMQNPEVREELMQEFSEILKLTRAQADRYTRIDILDESRAQLNSMPLKTRFSDQDKKIICIGKTRGAGGTEIGFALAHELKLSYYDQGLLKELLKRLEAGKSSVWDVSYLYEKKSAQGSPVYTGRPFSEEDMPFFRQMKEDFVRYHGLPKRDALFFTQSRLIEELARRENFVIMGRYADVVLTNAGIPHVNVFISAPFEKRVERTMRMYPEHTEKQVRKMLRKSDMRHMRDFWFFTGKEWGKSENYDITINSASYGINGSVALLIEMLEGEIDY